MRKTYRYGHRAHKRRHVFAVVVAVCILFFGPVAFIIYKDIKKNGSTSVSGTEQIVGQVVGDSSSKHFDVNEPFFSLRLPADWKEISREKPTTGGYIINWQATKKNADNRWLTVYVDAIPKTKSVNRLLPVVVVGSGLSAGDVSDNCSTFTGDSANKTQQRVDTAARWQGVDFICNLPSVVENQVGVGVVGAPVNQVTVTGPNHGAHNYYFLFTDHNIQPDYSILTDALQSFRAK